MGDFAMTRPAAGQAATSFARKAPAGASYRGSLLAWFASAFEARLLRLEM